MSDTHAEQSEINIDEVRDAIKENYGDPADGQDYIDRDAIDFDPADGLYAGTAVEGTSEIAGPHESQPPVDMDEAEVPEALEQRAARESADEAAGEEIDRNV